MIKIKFKEELFNLKSELSELTIGEFEQVCKIFNEDLTPNEKIIKIMIYLGIPDAVIDEMDMDDFLNVVKELNYDSTNDVLLNKFEHEGVTYVNNPDKFKLSVKNNIQIEEYIAKNNIEYMAEVMAILYPIPGMENTKEIITKRAALFRKELSSRFVIPIIYYISKLKQNV